MGRKKGFHLSEEHKKKLSEQRKGDKSSSWKGDNVSYNGLHYWIRRSFGKPCKCEQCGKETKNSRQFHWANKSGKYLRKRSDWERLCVSCHVKSHLDKDHRWLKRKRHPVYHYFI